VAVNLPATPLLPTALPVLPAHTRPVVRDLLGGHRDLLHELSHGLCGPFHVLFPGEFAVNIAAFRAALTRHGVDGRVYYAKKANKAACWVERCADAGIGIDVASTGELRESLGHGVRGEDIVVTGPAKSDELLQLAVRHRCLVTVDSPDELGRLIGLSTGRDTVRVLLRVLPPSQPDSRFGFDADELEAALHRCRQVTAWIRLEGFSFHLSGYDVQPRADLTGHLLGLCRRARALGLPAGTVDIGGGFAVDYVGAEDWHRFHSGNADEHFHSGRRFAGFYPYHSPTAGADVLTAVLAATPAGESRALSDLLRDAGVTLLAEPGRALLDQAGCTVFRVQGVKAREYGILTVDGTSLSLSEQWFASEFLPDPVLLRRHPRPGPAFAACVGGASCLESDMLTWRKIVFPTRPEPGDLLVYLNTAGYQMDSNESRFHELPLPPKVVLDEEFRWRLDRRPAGEAR
jgi:diaminopimelate decarboxylase